MAISVQHRSQDAPLSAKVDVSGLCRTETHAMRRAGGMTRRFQLAAHSSQAHVYGRDGTIKGTVLVGRMLRRCYGIPGTPFFPPGLSHSNE